MSAIRGAGVSEAQALGRPVTGEAGWLRAARLARWLAWASLFWMTVEGAVGLAAGLTAGSIALVGWGPPKFMFTLARRCREKSERGRRTGRGIVGPPAR